jgi:hypothetical protein
MFLPDSLELLVSSHRTELLRQAEAERLARQVVHRRSLRSLRPLRLRSRTAEALYGLAARLDPAAVPVRSPSPRVA